MWGRSTSLEVIFAGLQRWILITCNAECRVTSFHLQGRSAEQSRSIIAAFSALAHQDPRPIGSLHSLDASPSGHASSLPAFAAAAAVVAAAAAAAAAATAAAPAAPDSLLASAVSKTLTSRPSGRPASLKFSEQYRQQQLCEHQQQQQQRLQQLWHRLQHKLPWDQPWAGMLLPTVSCEASPDDNLYVDVRSLERAAAVSAARRRPFPLTAEEGAGGVAGDLSRLHRWLAAAGVDLRGIAIASTPGQVRACSSSGSSTYPLASLSAQLTLSILSHTT